MVTKTMNMKEILNEYELISYCRDSEEDSENEEMKFVLSEINMSDDTYTDIESVNHKDELQKGDFEIFNENMQNTYGFCRKKEYSILN